MAAKRRRRRSVGARPVRTISQVEERALRRELARATEATRPARWNADPDDVQRSVAKLVLALVEFLRKLMERQAIRRMEGKTLTSEEIEAVGQALMKLEETVHRMAKQFGLRPDELNLDLGPLGKLS
jgi:gas vesicle protein GvpK